MGRETEALQFVYSQVAEEVNEMYERYRKKCNLDFETDTERQLEILTSKKYISNTFILNVHTMAEYYDRGMISIYLAELSNYKIRIKVLLESV